MQADFEDESFRESLTATAEDLLEMNVVPVFNENDAVLSKRSPSPVRSLAFGCQIDFGAAGSIPGTPSSA